MYCCIPEVEICRRNLETFWAPACGLTRSTRSTNGQPNVTCCFVMITASTPQEPVSLLISGDQMGTDAPPSTAASLQQAAREETVAPRRLLPAPGLIVLQMTAKGFHQARETARIRCSTNFPLCVLSTSLPAAGALGQQQQPHTFMQARPYVDPSASGQHGSSSSTASRGIPGSHQQQCRGCCCRHLPSHQQQQGRRQQQ